MGTSALERIREEERKKDKLLEDWSKWSDIILAEKMWVLSHRYPDVAAQVVKGFDLGEEFARTFAEFTIYRTGWPTKCDDYWRVVGKTLQWILDQDCPTYNGVTMGFLKDIESYRDKLRHEERQVWARLLVTFLAPWNELNFLGDHSIVEAIPFLEEMVLVTDNDERLKLRDALINGRKPLAMYNLLRLLEIREAKTEKEVKRRIQ